MHLSWPGPLSLEMPPLDILVGAIDLLYEGVKLFLLLAQGGFTSEDACLALALVLLLLSPPLLSFCGSVATKQAPLWHLIDIEVSLSWVTTRVVLKQVKDGQRLSTDDGHQGEW